MRYASDRIPFGRGIEALPSIPQDSRHGTRTANGVRGGLRRHYAPLSRAFAEPSNAGAGAVITHTGTAST